MKRKPAQPAVSEADRALFREAVGPLRRLPAAPAPPRAEPPPPRAHMRARDEARVREELLAMPASWSVETGDELAWLRDGHSPHLLRRLKRAHYSIVGELDLHHLTADAAREILREFLAESAARGHGCVRVIHGKGLRSGPQGPVLKGLTDHVLRHDRHVVAFASAPAAEGGTGAVLVLLRNA